jgi:hypothetical protein
MRFWHSEDTLDAFGASDRNLDMIFLSEGRTGVEIRSLDKDAFHSIEALLFFFGTEVMQIVQDGAIEIIAEAIRLIIGERLSGLIKDSLEPQERGFGKLKSSACREVETEAKINHCSDNGWLLDFGTLPFRSFNRKLKTSQRVGFPEVDSFAEPIVDVLGRREGLILK